MNERHEGGLWCSEVLVLLDAYVDGRLSSEPLAAAQAHLTQCTNCSNFGASYARVVQTLRGAQPHALEPAELQRLKHRLHEDL